MRIPEQASWRLLGFPQGFQRQPVQPHLSAVASLGITKILEPHLHAASMEVYGIHVWWPLRCFHLYLSLDCIEEKQCLNKNTQHPSCFEWHGAANVGGLQHARVRRWHTMTTQWHHPVETPSAVRKLARGHFGFCQAPAWEYKFTTENNRIETTWNNTTNWQIQQSNMQVMNTEYNELSAAKPAVPLVTS